MDPRSLFQEISRRRSLGEPLALGTLVRTGGSTFRRPGARVLLSRSGAVAGAVSGGCVEGDLALRLGSVLAGGRPALVRYDAAAADPLFGLGSGCDGELDILLEPITPALAALLADAAERLPFEPVRLRCAFATDAEPLGTTWDDPALPDRAGVLRGTLPATPSLLVVGVGPVSRPIARLARELGWRVVVADPRPALVTPEAFPEAEERAAAAPGELSALLRPGLEPYAVVGAHLFEPDRRAVTSLLAEPSIRTVSLLGSRARSARILAEIPETDPVRERLLAPAGLDLGAETPEEIAFAILAEIQMHRRSASGRPLRELAGAIHARSGTAAGSHTGEPSAVLLAAGRASRFGAPKQVAILEGEPLVRRAARAALAAGCTDVLVVLGAGADEVRGALSGLPVRFVLNGEYESGIGSSVRAALAALGDAPAALFLLADQPNVDAAAIRRLLERRRKTGASIVAARYPEGAGVPALVDASLFEVLRTLDGDRGAREILRKLPGATELVELPEGTLSDVDIPSDLV